jgi:uncharacterized protein YijF (DUF1287 family)
MKKIRVISIIALCLMGAVVLVFAIHKYPVINIPYEKLNDTSTRSLNKRNNNGIFKAAMEFAQTVSWKYDPAYYSISYPNGDVPSGGACTDVIIRVLRKNNMDLQKLIHEDKVANFSAYPNKWGSKTADANIDHRRVPNIMKYFDRKGYGLPITNQPNDYVPGDIVCWELSPGITHIGVVLENQDIFHNIGPTSRIESGFLFTYKIIGHYRIRI